MTEEYLEIPEGYLLVEGYDYNYDSYIEELWTPQQVFNAAMNNGWLFYGYGLRILDVDYMTWGDHVSDMDVEIYNKALVSARFKPKKVKEKKSFLLETLRKIGPVVEEE